MTSPSHLLWFDHWNNTWRRATTSYETPYYAGFLQPLIILSVFSPNVILRFPVLKYPREMLNGMLFCIAEVCSRLEAGIPTTGFLLFCYASSIKARSVSCISFCCWTILQCSRPAQGWTWIPESSECSLPRDLVVTARGWREKEIQELCLRIFSCGPRAQIWALAASMKLSVSFRLLDLGQSTGLLGRVISSSQGLCVSAPGDCEDGEVGGMNGFGRGTEVLGENLPRRHFVHHKLHLPDPGRRGGKPATNRFSYGAAIVLTIRPLKCHFTDRLKVFRIKKKINKTIRVTGRGGP
jgi:hypothetical protein